MAQIKPLKHTNGVIGESVSGTDTILPALLGTGTRDGTKFLRDDGTWQTVSGSGGSTIQYRQVVAQFNPVWPGSHTGTFDSSVVVGLSPTSRIISCEPLLFNTDNTNSEAFYFLRSRFNWHVNVSGGVGSAYFGGKVWCEDLYNGTVTFIIYYI